MTEQEFLARLQAGENFDDLLREAMRNNLAVEMVTRNTLRERPGEGTIGRGITPANGSPV